MSELKYRGGWKEEVVPPGIEPGTHGFSVRCSTNWAMAPFLFCNEWCFSIASAKVRHFSETTKFFSNFLSKNRKIVPKCSQNATFSVFSARFCPDKAFSRHSLFLPRRNMQSCRWCVFDESFIRRLFNVSSTNSRLRGLKARHLIGQSGFACDLSLRRRAVIR